MQDFPELVLRGEHLLSFVSNPLNDADQGVGFFHLASGDPDDEIDRESCLMLPLS